MHRKFIQDSRSYSGFETYTDHKIVKTKIKLDWWRLKQQREKTERLNINKLENIETRSKYKQELDIKLNQIEERETPDKMWKNITSTLKEVASDTLGMKESKSKKCMSTEIEKLSKEQMKLRDDSEATKDKEVRRKLKMQRNQIMNSIKNIVKKEKNDNDNKSKEEQIK